jgi:hypothetical protein
VFPLHYYGTLCQVLFQKSSRTSTQRPNGGFLFGRGLLHAGYRRHAQRPDDEAWRADIQVGGPANKVNFKLDSGSDVTAITYEESQKLNPQPKYKTSRRDLRGPDRAK